MFRVQILTDVGVLLFLYIFERCFAGRKEEQIFLLTNILLEI
jgi:hypothetical protein